MRKTLLLLLIFFTFTSVFGQGLKTSPGVITVTSLPVTCTAVGSDTSSAPVRYQGKIYTCLATNTWTPVLGVTSSLTAGRLPYVDTGGVLADSANATLSSGGTLFALKGSFGSASLTTAQSNITPASSATIGQIIRGVTSQSANLSEWQTVTPTTVASVTSTGAMISTAGFSSYTADGVWNANARPGGVVSPTSTTQKQIIFGYADGGSDQYYGSIGLNANSVNYNGIILVLQNRIGSGVPESFNRFQIAHNGQHSWGAGSGAVDAGIGRNAAGVLEANSGTAGTYRDILVRNLLVGTAGGYLQIKTGSNACSGSSTLSSGTVTVSTTCTGTTWGTDFIILLTPRGSSTGTLRVSTHTAATSFVVTSTDAASSDPVGWMIIKQN